MESNNFDRELQCIFFPGFVVNDDKALQCLGGIRGISQIYSNPLKKRMGLSFRPDDPLVKKIYGDYRRRPGVLLKVKVKKTKDGDVVKREIISTSVVGHVKKMIVFDSLCDFQYMPIHREGTSNGPSKCILENIIPSGVANVNFLFEPVPLFITPSNFTRSDKPYNYAYTVKKYAERRDHSKQNSDEQDTGHQRLRSDRIVPSTRIKFNLTDELPTEPHEFFIKMKCAKIKAYPELEQEFETVKKLFDERPICSQQYVRYHTKVRIHSLKMLLPCIGVYMSHGPWRMLWVRFGYDPRKHPEARIYQTLDFRLRHHAGVRSMVEPRDRIVYNKKADRVHFAKRDADEPSVTELPVNEAAVILRPGVVPLQRQVYYQYCDIQLGEVQELVSKEPPPGYLCHVKRGWLPPNTEDVCRDHMFRYVKATLLATHASEMKIEQGSTDEESNSEDDETITTEPDDA